MKLKHWLIPGRHNKFHPHIMRPIGLLIVLTVLVAIPIIYNAVSVNKFQVLGYATNITINDLSQLTNEKRVENGLPALQLNTKLNSAAFAKAQDMINNNYWAHVSPNGTEPWYFITQSGYPYTTAGENLAKGFYTSSGVVNAWMNSQSHKDNIINTNYKDVGYAVLDGVLLGDELTLVVAMYGSEYQAPTQSVTPPSANTNNSSTSENSPPSNRLDAVAPSLQTVPETPEFTDGETSNNTGVEPAIGTNSKQANEGDVLGSALLLTIETYESLNWGQKASILILSTMILLFVLKHTLIWREKRAGFRHIWLKSHPLGQASVLMLAIIVTLFSGVGVVL